MIFAKYTRSCSVSLVLLLSTCSPITSFADTAIYRNSDFGFSLAPPSLITTDNQHNSTLQTIQFFGPVQHGFSASVNIQVQKNERGWRDYRDTSNKLFEKLGMRVLSEKTSTHGGHKAIEWQSEGTLKGRAIRFLSLAIFRNSEVLLITCAALQANFPEYEPQFRKTLDSVRFE